MEPSGQENDLSQPQRSRMTDFRFTDPVRFLFEHMQGDSNRPNPEKINNEDWSKNSNKTIEGNAVSPSLKGSFQDLYNGDNIFNHVAPGVDNPVSPDNNNVFSGDNDGPVESNTASVPPPEPVQESPAEIGNHISENDTSKLLSSKKTPQEKTPHPKQNTFSSLVYRASKLEAVANMARNKITGRRQEQSPTKPSPNVKPPPLTRHLASRAIRRQNKGTLPANATPVPQATPLQASTTGTRPTTVSNHPPPEKLPTPPPVAPDSEPDSEVTVQNGEESEHEDPHQMLLQLCKKSDWNGVEGLIKQFSKSGLPANLIDPVSLSFLLYFHLQLFLSRYLKKQKQNIYFSH